MSTERIAIAAGIVALALVLGALGFQYGAGMPPCEMCHWQRWPHIQAAVFGIVGGVLIATKRVDGKYALPLALLTLALVAVSGAIGAYQAAVEWGLLRGPAACTGAAVVLTGSLDLNHSVVRCDVAAWRLLGISLAGYNAAISLATAGAGSLLLARQRRND
jgi:disulfide bond formation protein DsbB